MAQKRAPMNRMDTEQPEARWTVSIRSLAQLPIDVVIVTVFVVLVEAVVNGFGGRFTVLQMLLAFPLVFFLPGYALLSALYPRIRIPDEADTRWLFRDSRGLLWNERVALSFGTSLALIVPLGILLEVFGLGYGTGVVVNSLTVIILVGMAIGGVERLSLDPDERYHVPFGRWRVAFERATSGSPVDTLLNLALMGLALAAISALVFAFVAPPAAESYSGFTVLTENAQGELVASGYPQELVTGESFDVVISIDNHEQATTSYTVVGEVQRVRVTDSELTVVERQRFDAFQTTLQPGQSVREPSTVSSQMVGDDLRVVYYLYTGTPPAEPSEETAYETLYFWVSVSEGTTG
jgi:uncharacterized membrane protein